MDYTDPYAERIAAQQALLARATAPRYSAEQAAQRRAENDRLNQLGLLGVLSGDESLAGVGSHVHKQAQAERAPRVSDQGVYDPLSGSFAYHPEVQRARQEQDLERLHERQAAGQQAWQMARQGAQEKAEEAERQRQFLGVQNAATRAATAGTREAAQDARLWRAEDTLRGDFDKITRDLRDEMAATGKIKSVLGGYAGRKLDPIAQQSVVVLLNKFLDPGSVVREGEFDRVVKAQGLDNRARLLVDRVMRGDTLSPETVGQINTLANVYEQAAAAKMQQYGTDYSTIAQRRGLDVGSVISDPRWRSAGGALPQTMQRLNGGAPRSAPPGNSGQQRYRVDF